VQKLLRAFEAHALGCGDEVGRHHVAHGLVEVALEAHVAVGEDADRPAVAADHGQARNLVAAHEFERRKKLLIRIDGDRVDDHAGLGLLHLRDLENLLVDGHVLVDDAEAALARHADGRGRLGHRVHGRRQDGNGQGDARGQVRANIDVFGNYLALGRTTSRHVVEGQSLCAKAPSSSISGDYTFALRSVA
jgi:hypothetical protein